jgi:chemotaxis protein methyltransferase CheR
MRSTLPDYLLARLSDLLATRTGLHFPAERWGDLERGVGAAAPAFGAPDAESCARRLLSAPLTHREIEVLASCLTVGETYFFREKRSFEALEQHILPDLLHAREHDGRRLRLWSAGCCTGEEPYSIAMLLDRLLPDSAARNNTLLATDINPEFLRKAARGEYGEWSFRDTPAWVRERYFRPRKAGRFEIQERIRRHVQFSCLNLADDVYPSLASNTSAMDVIFCRNVLMYFTAARARAVIENLHRSLVDGGWLIVSPAETSTALFSRFTTVEFHGAIFYRKPANAEAPSYLSRLPAPSANPWSPAAPLPTTDEPIPQAKPAATRMAESCNTTVPAAGGHVSPGRVARDFANQGRLDEAIEWCHRAIAADKLNPTHHFLLATVQQELGLGETAAQSLARALYLDPDFVLAHFALGNLRRAQCRRYEARRHFGNALALLRAYPPGEILPESEGLTAGRLGEIIESTQASLPGAATSQ